MIKIKTKISRIAAFSGIFLLIIFFYVLTLKPAQRLPLHQELILKVFSPFQTGIHFITGTINSVWSKYVFLVNLKDENIILKQNLVEKTADLNLLNEVFVENKRLRDLMELGPRYDFKEVLGAKVIASDPRSDFRVIVINKGEADGVAVNMPVVSKSGLVGRIAEVGKSISRVILITDPNNAVDAFVQRSRARALLMGDRSATKLERHYYLSRLEYLGKSSDVNIGDVIVTTGMDSIYPSGIPIGTIEEMKKEVDGIFKEAKVVPFVDFNSLEEVIVVKR